jgi:hypothetical protein
MRKSSQRKRKEKSTKYEFAKTTDLEGRKKV